MKLISYLNENNEDQLALLVDFMAYDIQLLDDLFPSNMSEFLFDSADLLLALKAFDTDLNKSKKKPAFGKPIEGLKLLPPVPFPTSIRDAYAFRQHVETARKNRGADMIPEFDQFPVFYFSNHHAAEGPGKIELMPDHLQKLDFELEVAVVIGKEGRNIWAGDADDYIVGYMIMNDFSARQFQAEEMKLNLGPAKGKDFATTFGPFLVTTDELEPYLIANKNGRIGAKYNLDMIATVNGKQVSKGNLGDMNWTFAEIIERCSYGATLYPGDIIGSGTVGTGCFLELNGTAKRNNPDTKEQWLQVGDEISLEVAGLGKLTNTITAEADKFSILAKKKNV